MKQNYDALPDGSSAVSAAAEDAWDKTFGPEPDRVDQAIAAMRAVVKIRGDKPLLDAIAKRLEEGRQALTATKKGS